jgi:dTDP-4-amino-4,6-dideoxygalactose transaminase
MKNLGIHDPVLNAEDLKSIALALESNWISSRGPAVEEFETKISTFFELANKPLATNSGSSALLLSLRAAGVKSGDHVLCSAYGFVATANAVRRLGAEPIFLGPENPLLPVVTAGQLRRFFTEEVSAEGKFKETGRPIKGFLYNEPYGLADPSLPEMVDFLQGREMFLVEDASQSFGLKLGKKFLGTFGHLGVFSLNGNKTLTAGAGGLLLSNRADWLQMARKLSSQSRSDPFDFFYDEVAYNFDLSNVSAALALAQAKRLSETLARKENIRRWYRESLESWKLLDEGNNYPAWLNVALAPKALSRAEFQGLATALADSGIRVRPTFPAVTENSHYRDASIFWAENNHYVFNHGLCLPSGPGLQREDIYRVAEALEREGKAMGIA